MLNKCLVAVGITAVVSQLVTETGDQTSQLLFGIACDFSLCNILLETTQEKLQPNAQIFLL